ncbi:hypothetical protein SXCC_04720 [Gluconacetobacter sp. SXCC-1]|nr:hypothetical protein SXCC_04720 [Gluconacetobacter sp. SXCC-1]
MPQGASPFSCGVARGGSWHICGALSGAGMLANSNDTEMD